MVPQHKHFAKHYLLCFGLIANYLRHLQLGISWSLRILKMDIHMGWRRITLFEVMETTKSSHGHFKDLLSQVTKTS